MLYDELYIRLNVVFKMRKEDIEAEEQLQLSLSRRDKWRDLMTKAVKPVSSKNRKKTLQALA